MTRKELIDEIVKLQHVLGMTTEVLKRFMYVETGFDKVQKVSDEGLEKLRDLLRAKAENEKAAVDVKDTQPGAEVKGSGAATVTVLVITDKETLKRAIFALAAAVEPGADEAT